MNSNQNFNTNTQHEIGISILRISLGIMFIAHALLKVWVFTPAGTVGFFESVGLPGFLAYVTIVAELLGGAALVAGIFTRWVCIALLPILLGSILFVHGDKGWVFSNQGGGWEYPLFLMMATISQWFLGNGSYSLQKYLFRS